MPFILRPSCAAVFIFAAVGFFTSNPLNAACPATTAQYNDPRTGANTSETCLTAASAQTSDGEFPVGFPGGSLSLSSNGTSTTSAILWGIYFGGSFSGGNPITAGTAKQGHLIAYGLGTASTSTTAGTLNYLWRSVDTWSASTFALPTIVNRRVYVPTSDSGVLVYATF